jgi:excisionase family DNA binding protein
MESTTIPDDLITPTEAAQLLHVHLATVYRWIDQGRLPTWRVGGCVGHRGRRRVRRSDVLALIRPEQSPASRLRPAVAERAAYTRWLADLRARYPIG